MELMRHILKISNKKSCYFFQRNKCILSRNSCIFCNLKIQKINGVDKTEYYLSFVTTRNMNNRNFYFALFAFLFSLITLIIKLVEVMKPEIK